MYTDSKPLFESIYSKKQVDRKTVRRVIRGMKDSLTRREVNSFHLIDTKKMLADIFTKDSANYDLVKRVIEDVNLKHAIDTEEIGNKETGEDSDSRSASQSESNHIVTRKSIYTSIYAYSHILYLTIIEYTSPPHPNLTNSPLQHCYQSIVTYRNF